MNRMKPLLTLIICMVVGCGKRSVPTQEDKRYDSVVRVFNKAAKENHKKKVTVKF